MYIVTAMYGHLHLFKKAALNCRSFVCIPFMIKCKIIYYTIKVFKSPTAQIDWTNTSHEQLSYICMQVKNTPS